MDIKIGNNVVVYIPFKRLGIDSANDIKSVNGSFVIRDDRHTHNDIPVISPTEYTIREHGCPVYNKMPVNAHCCAEHPVHGFSVHKDTDPTVIGDVISVKFPGYLLHKTGEFDVVLDIMLSKGNGHIIKAFNNLFVLSLDSYIYDKPADIYIPSTLLKNTVIDNRVLYNNVVIHNAHLITDGILDNNTLSLK